MPQPKPSAETQAMIDACMRHTLYSWSARGKVDPMPISDAEGIYLHGPDGQRWLDFNSQLMSVNIGHKHPRVVAAMKQAAEGLIYAFPGSATPMRAALSQKLAGLLPEGMNTVFYTLGGAEANENAIKLARLSTGRFKILSPLPQLPRRHQRHDAAHGRPPSHGPTSPAPPASSRSWTPGPTPVQLRRQTTPRSWRTTSATSKKSSCTKGRTHIAAMFIETVTGTNGILPPPEGLPPGPARPPRQVRHPAGVRRGHVPAGGARASLFAFEHGDITPRHRDCMAKGLTSSYIPLGAVGMKRSTSPSHFDDNVYWGGLTYNSPCLCVP